MHQYRTTSQTRRALGEGQVVEHDVVQVSCSPFRVVELEHGFLLRGHQGVAAVTLYSHFRSATHNVGTTVACDVVPQRFYAILRDRERDAAIGVGEAITAIQQLGSGSVLDGVVIHPLRRRTGATSLIDRHLVAVRVGVEHRNLTWGQVVFVLIQVGFGDGEQRLVISKRIDVVLAWRGVTRRSLGDTTVPLRNSARRVAGFLGTERGEVCAQFGCFCRRNRSERAASGQCQRNRGPHQRVLFQHLDSP